MGKWRFSIEIVDLPIENGDFPSETPAGMLSSAETSTQISSQTPCNWPSHYPHRKTHGKTTVIWGIPNKMVGLFHGKSHLEMDDGWGYPLVMTNP